MVTTFRVYSRPVIEKYSLRTAQIEEVAKARNISDDDKVELGSRTREAKTTDFSMSELRENWRNRLSEDEARQVQKVIEAANDGGSSDFTFVQDSKEPKRHKFWDLPLNERFEIIDKINEQEDEQQQKIEDAEAQETPDKKAERFNYIGNLEVQNDERNLRE